MTKKASIHQQLTDVNAQLAAYEDGWPWRGPVAGATFPLKFSADPARLPKRAVEALRAASRRLAEGLPGWEVQVDVYAWTGQDAGAIANVFVNGVDSGYGLRYFNDEVPGGKGTTTWTPGLNAVAEAFPGPVERLIARFRGYPAERLSSPEYKALCAQRCKLQSQL